MDDIKLVHQLNMKNENALAALIERYSGYVSTVIRNISRGVLDSSDIEEVISDVFIKIWNNAGHLRAETLRSYIAVIARNLAIDMYRKLHTAKREGSTYEASLEELAECVGTQDPAETQLGAEALGEAISVYLRSLDQQKRQIFISRYFFLDRCADIAEKAGIPEGSVRSILSRTRKGLKNYLEKEGFVI